MVKNMAIESMFKDACESGSIKDMNDLYDKWKEMPEIQNTHNYDENFLYASAIIYGTLFIISRDSYVYEQMVAFFESAKTGLYKPKNTSVSEWYKSTAEIVVYKAKSLK